MIGRISEGKSGDSELQSATRVVCVCAHIYLTREEKRNGGEKRNVTQEKFKNYFYLCLYSLLLYFYIC